MDNFLPIDNLLFQAETGLAGRSDADIVADDIKACWTGGRKYIWQVLVDAAENLVDCLLGTFLSLRYRVMKEIHTSSFKC